MWSGDYRAFSDAAYTDLSVFEHPSFLVNNNSNNKTHTQTRNEMLRFLLAFWCSFRPSFSLVLEIENAPDWWHLPFPGYFWRCVIITLVFSLHFRAFNHGRHMQETVHFPKPSFLPIHTETIRLPSYLVLLFRELFENSSLSFETISWSGYI